ncbi:MAG: YceD family protein [Sphingomicrobium sp.]
MTDRFAHHLRLDQVRDGERIDLAANEAERGAVAKRLGLQQVDRLEAHVTLTRTGEIVRASGRLNAALDQSCVVTSEPVPAHVDEPFELVFMPEPATAGHDEEIELGESDCDVVFYDGGEIDLGTAIADTLALSLDPYPRSAGADAALKEAGVLTEAEASPFAALAKLKTGGDGS